ncbi:MAG: hypothetical protein HFJ52_00575, partial [Clostridia bacterium]|nr:hypothetical protein [Clostridia bacterium]
TTIDELSPNQTYRITAIAYDNAGNASLESDTTTATTKGELKAPDIQISGNTKNGYYVGDVTITVNDTSESTKTRVARIKVTGAGTERTITGTSGSFTITADGTYTITALAEDAQGNKSDIATKPAFTRDATAPSASLSVGSKGTYTISVTAYGSDSTSGVQSYKFEYKKTSTSTWTTATTKTTSATSCTYTYSVPSDNTTYNLRVTVTDNAGWTNEGTGSATTNKANTAPTVTASFASKTTNSITINAKGQDREGGTLTYTLYIKTASGSWQSKATTTGSPNSQVTMTARGLTEYTDYYYKVDVRDNGNLTGTTGQLGAIKTYCPGTKTCTGTITEQYCGKCERRFTSSLPAATICFYCRLSGDTREYEVMCQTCRKVIGTTSMCGTCNESSPPSPHNLLICSICGSVSSKTHKISCGHTRSYRTT